MRRTKTSISQTSHRVSGNPSTARVVACSVIRATMLYMAIAPPPLSIWLGNDGLAALEEIALRRGIDRAEAARQAIAETAQRDQRRSTPHEITAPRLSC